MLRVQNEKELAGLGLRLHPTDPNRLVPLSDAPTPSSLPLYPVVPQGMPEGAAGDSERQVGSGPIIGPSIDELIALGKHQWKEIKETEKYLTGAHYDFGCTLQAIKDWCGDDKRAWAKTYRRIGVSKQRASEFRRYPEVFSSREEAAKCPVAEANKRIRKKIQEDNREEYNDYSNCFALPQWLRDAIERDYGFPTLDVASSHDMHFGERYFTPDEDALKQEWDCPADKVVYCHPPFNTSVLPLWVKKAYEESQKGHVVVSVLPFWRRYDWFDEIVVKYAEVRHPARKVVCEGFGPKEGKQCGNVTAPNKDYDTILAIFRKDQIGFTSDWVHPVGEDGSGEEAVIPLSTMMFDNNGPPLPGGFTAHRRRL